MILSKFIMPITCLCLLTACDNKVSKEKFLEEIENIEEHKYKKAIVKYSEDTTNGKEDGKFIYTLVDGRNYEISDSSYYSSVASYYLFLDISAIADEDGFSYFETSIKDDDPNAKIKKITNYFMMSNAGVST